MELEYWLLYLGVIAIVTIPVLALYAVLSIIARLFGGKQSIEQYEKEET